MAISSVKAENVFKIEEVDESWALELLNECGREESAPEELVNEIGDEAIYVEEASEIFDVAEGIESRLSAIEQQSLQYLHDLEIKEDFEVQKKSGQKRCARVSEVFICLANVSLPGNRFGSNFGCGCGCALLA